MSTFTISYYAAAYKGERTVEAEDSEHAIAKVRAMIRREMTLSMYADGYKVVSRGSQ